MGGSAGLPPTFVTRTNTVRSDCNCSACATRSGRDGGANVALMVLFDSSLILDRVVAVHHDRDLQRIRQPRSATPPPGCGAPAASARRSPRRAPSPSDARVRLTRIGVLARLPSPAFVIVTTTDCPVPTSMAVGVRSAMASSAGSSSSSASSSSPSPSSSLVALLLLLVRLDRHGHAVVVAAVRVGDRDDLQDERALAAGLQGDGQAVGPVSKLLQALDVGERHRIDEQRHPHQPAHPVGEHDDLHLQVVRPVEARPVGRRLDAEEALVDRSRLILGGLFVARLIGGRRCGRRDAQHVDQDLRARLGPVGGLREDVGGHGAGLRPASTPAGRRRRRAPTPPRRTPRRASPPPRAGSAPRPPPAIGPAPAIAAARSRPARRRSSEWR